MTYNSLESSTKNIVDSTNKNEVSFTSIFSEEVFLPMICFLKMVNLFLWGK
tara:strand:+ start:1358 stop:1510 length:153 start_codon:yes stop_codon:yes gene_type:complete